jgi:hypothetical protein
MTVCASCGASDQTDVGFCTQCGTRLQAPAAPLSATSSTPPTNGLAIASLVCGILGISVVALALGYVGRSQIRRSRPRQRGNGMALAGIVLGWIGFAGALAILAVFVIAASNSTSTNTAIGADSFPASGHVVAGPTTAPDTAPAQPSTTLPVTTVPTPSLPTDVVAIANTLAARLSAHDFASVRILEPSKADWTDEYFESLDHDLVHDTVFPLRTTDAGSGWTALEGGLVAEETGRTRLFCFRWTVNPSLRQIDETGPTRLVRDMAPGVDVQSLAAEIRSTC